MSTASTPRRCRFLIPGDWHTPTGGYAYARRLVGALRRLGWTVEVLRVDGGWPWPDAAALAQAGRQVAAIEDGSLVVADGLAFGALPDLAHAHAARLRWVALVHHPLHLETGLDPAACDGLRTSEARALQAAAQVVVTSRRTARDVAALGVPAGRIAVVEPGTDPVEGAPVRGDAHVGPPAPAGRVDQVRHTPALVDPGRQHLARPRTATRPEPPLRLLCVATLTPRKGHAVLLEALAGLAVPVSEPPNKPAGVRAAEVIGACGDASARKPAAADAGRRAGRDWVLDNVGSATRDPAHAARLMAIGRAPALAGRVAWHGEVDAATLASLRARADVFVLPSLHEGYGMAVAEALAHGLPVLASRAGALADTLPSQAGLLVPPGDPVALRAALARLLDDPALRDRLAAGARDAARRLPAWPAQAARFAAVLEGMD